MHPQRQRDMSRPHSLFLVGLLIGFSCASPTAGDPFCWSKPGFTGNLCGKAKKSATVPGEVEMQSIA